MEGMRTLQMILQKLYNFSENDVFQERDEFPFSKMLTLYRTEPFQLNATYSLPNQVPYLRREIGNRSIISIV
jgi:hypothetical protein